MIPEAFIQYLVHFHGDRDYFECHEILEEYWKEADPGNKESILVGFIQLAVSAYHYRRGNYSGAKRTLAKSEKILANKKTECEKFAIDHIKLINLVKELRNAITTKRPYKSINLPITDKKLLSECKKECERKGFAWGEESDLQNLNLINRHSRRDRTDVILERENALVKRKDKKFL